MTRSLVSIIGIIWLFAVTFNYYIVHKPFTIENMLAIFNVLGDIFVAGALYALAVAIGRRVLRGFSFATFLEGIVFQAGVGLGVISLTTFAFGLLGWLNPILFWLLLLSTLFLLRSDLPWCNLRALRMPIIESKFERALAVFVLVTLAFAFLFALLPPTAWDTQVYQLLQARLAIEQGRLTPPPDILYFSFPLLVQMLFLAGMLLKGDIVAQLIHFGFLPLTLGTAMAFAQRWFNARVAWLTVAILVAVPSLLLISTWAYVDLALTFYATSAFSALMIAVTEKSKRWFALTGLFIGFTLGVKYTAAIVPIALAVVLLFRRYTNVRHWLWLIGVSVVSAAPWYLRTWFFTGNPVYPFLFGGKYWDAFRAEWFSRFGTGLANVPVQLLTAPWDATVSSSEGTLSYGATLGPLLLMFVPLLILAWAFGEGNQKLKAQNGILRDIMIFSLVLYIFWLSGVAESKLLLQSRLLFPAFPMFALGAALAIDRLDSFNLPHFSLQRFARLVIAIVLALTLFGEVLAFAGNGPLPYLVGAESRSQFIDSNLGGYAQAFNFINERLPANVRVLELWEPRSYYIQRNTQPDAILDLLPHLVWQYGNADAIAATLRADGYTHVLLSRAGLDYLLQTGYDPITSEDTQILQDLVTRHFVQVYGKTPLQIITRDGKPAVAGLPDDAYAVYEILPAGQ
jgi:4-amino-4-deoxy-L-arabinose transferase-like glycosyltransferase